MSADAGEGGAPRVLLRTLARLLETALMKRSVDCPVEWVGVVYEAPVAAASRTWRYDDSILHVSFCQGHSEGYLLHVYARTRHQDPGSLQPLFTIKVLCSVERAVQEIAAVWAVLNSPEFSIATGQQAN